PSAETSDRSISCHPRRLRRKLPRTTMRRPEILGAWWRSCFHLLCGSTFARCAPSASQRRARALVPVDSGAFWRSRPYARPAAQEAPTALRRQRFAGNHPVPSPERAKARRIGRPTTYYRRLIAAHGQDLLGYGLQLLLGQQGPGRHERLAAVLRG